MLPVIERPIILLLAGFFLSFLEMTGIADPTQHAANEQVAQTIVGGLLAAITIVAGLMHHYYIEKNKKLGLTAGDTQPTITLLTRVTRLFILVRNLFYAKSTPQVTDQQQQQS